ncbi:MAG TPA: tail fiber domain-containing protein [Allocoleopsis sp.]
MYTILNNKIDNTSNELQNDINTITYNFENYSNTLSKHLEEYYTPTLIGWSSNLLIKAGTEIKFNVNNIENLRINEYNEIEQYIQFDVFRDGIEYILLSGQAGQWVSLRKLMLEKAKTDLQNTFNDVTGEVADIVQTGSGIATQLAGFGDQILDIGGVVGTTVVGLTAGTGIIVTAQGEASKNDYKLVINTILKALTNVVNNHSNIINHTILPKLVWVIGDQYIAYDDIKIMASDVPNGQRCRIRFYKTQTNLLFNPYLYYHFSPNNLQEDNSLNNRHFNITTVAGTANPISVFNVRNTIQIYDSGSYLTLPTANWSLYPDLTISFWIYASGLQGIPEIFSFLRGTTTEVRFYRFTNYASLSIGNTQRWISSSTWPTQFNNKWVHVIICLRQSANTSQGFIKINNGTAETFTSSALPSATYINTIGNSSGLYQGTAYYFQIAQFGIFTTALTATDHTFLYTNNDLPYTTVVDENHTHTKAQINGLNDYFQPHPTVANAIYYGNGNVGIGTYPTAKWNVPSKLTIYGDLEIVNGGLRQNGQQVVGIGNTAGSGTTGVLSTSLFDTESIPISAVEFLQSTLDAKVDYTDFDTVAPYTYVNEKITDTSNYVSSVNNLLQTDINSRAFSSHNHIISDITGLSQEFVNSSNYTLTTSNELIANINTRAFSSHNHIISDITGLAQEFINSSNYTLTTSNNLVNNINTCEKTLILGDGLYKDVNNILNSYWKLSGSGQLYNTNIGSVGIGNTNPLFTFDVGGGFRNTTSGAFSVCEGFDGGSVVGLFMNGYFDLSFGIYTGSSGAFKSFADATAVAGGGGITGKALRLRVPNTATQGIIFENSAEQLLASIRGSDGLTCISGNLGIGTTSPVRDLHLHTATAGAGQYIQFTDGTTTASSTRGCLIGKSINQDMLLYNYQGNNAIVFSTSTTTGTPNERIRILGSGLVGIGNSNPASRLHVASGTYNSGTQNFRYFNYATAPVQATTALTDVCGVFDSSIWVKSWIASSSDSRIKKEINDINDDTALQKILTIQPKTYKYIDDIANTSNTVYGFIAQQIAEVLPDAVTIKTEIIPNIYQVLHSTSNIIYINTSNYTLSSNLDINLITLDGKRSTYKVQEYSSNYITVNEDLNSSNVFAYGYAVEDFHALNKDYIFTLNVCATQQLYQMIQQQAARIQALEDKIASLAASAQ